MTRCPQCGQALGFRLRRRPAPQYWSKLPCFRCPSCGVALGYVGLSDLVATAFQFSIAATVFALFYAFWPTPFPTDLPLWLVATGIVAIAAAIFALIPVADALLIWLVPAQPLPREYLLEDDETLQDRSHPR